MKTVALHTAGCKVNYTETTTIARQFLERGFQVVPPDGPCDIFVLNTCSVTDRADRECRQIIRRVRRSSPAAYVVVVGCYAQLQPDEIAAMEGVDLILGTKDKFRIIERAGSFAKQDLPQIFVSCIDEASEFEPSDSGALMGRTRAFLKVQDGCDYRCTFCTIPSARGASRSRPVEDVLRQAGRLLREGYREIVLTGVNVGDYGRRSGTDLLELLKGFERLGAVDRIRISSIEPNLLTPEMVSFLLGSGRFCNHFHIPLQSGSDSVLAMMRRRYRSSDYRALVERIRAEDPDAAIGADVLVGFPGETALLFEETRTFLESLPVSYLHVFAYSAREGTPAAGFSGSVGTGIRSERSRVLREMSLRKRAGFQESFVGRTLPVLFEDRSKDGTATGLTTNYIRVTVPFGDDLVNEIRDVTIREATGVSCAGEFSVTAPAEINSETTTVESR
jgi:threonylcarbamoyladenosine tRNA methylthiotransferase MtaB